MKPIIVIPARLASSRFPNKILVDIKGKTMLQRVWEQAVAADIGEVLVACDSARVAAIIQDLGGNAVLTNPDHPSGSDRIYEALGKFDANYDHVINLQCDLPTIEPTVISDVLKPFAAMDVQISTLAHKFDSLDDASDPNNVKVAIAFKETNLGKALSQSFSNSVWRW